MEVKIEDLKEGDIIWCADYSHSRGGARCDTNIEPVKVIISRDSNGSNWWRNIRVDFNMISDSYLPTDNIFYTESEAIKHYKKCLMNHVKFLLQGATSLSYMKTLEKRLVKFDLERLINDVKEVSDTINNLIQKMDS